MNGTMPAGGPRATAAEIQVVTKWIAAGFPMATMACGATSGGGAGGATGGMGGASGTTVGGGTGGAAGTMTGGNGGATGGTGGGGTAAGGLPCNVKDLMQTRCQSCHSSPPRNGAPFSLVSFSDVQAHAQAALTDMTNGVMPLGGPRSTSAELKVMSDWIAAGFPMATTTCGATGGTGGASGTGGATTGGGTGGAGGTATGGMGGTTPGTGGAGGTRPGTGGATGGTGGAGGATGGTCLPSDVQSLMQSLCTRCHSSPPTGGAPFSLVSYADVRAHASAAVSDMTNGVMPLGGPRATSAQIQTLQNWINAGFPSGTSCGGGGTGTGGAAGGMGGASGGTGGAVGGTGGAAGGGEAGEGGGDDH